jgi:hypothetical protein
MILPEHKAGILRQQEEFRKKKRPILDEQRLEELSYIIREAVNEDREIRVRVFDEFEDGEISGRITKIEHNRIQVSSNWTKDWIPIEDIVSIEKA